MKYELLNEEENKKDEIVVLTNKIKQKTNLMNNELEEQNKILEKFRKDVKNTKKNLALTYFNFEDMRTSIGHGQFVRIITCVILVIVLVLCVIFV